MRKNVKYLISSALITLSLSLSLSMPQAIHGMDNLPNTEEQKSLSGMQLVKGADDTLEASLGMDSKFTLRISVSLEAFKTPFDQEQMEIPVRLFLTDFTSLPTTHPAVEFPVKVGCDSKKHPHTLPEKPASFDSYEQFTGWLNQAYLTNEVKITYDFPVDVQQLAPSLAQHVNFIPPGGYRFIGTHVVDNAKMTPDGCSPKVAYDSQWGNINATTVTLGGILYLNKNPYPIEDHQQVFPHKMVQEKVLKTDDTKKFYHHQWLAQSEITTKLTYEEFPKNLVQNWPNVPSDTYSLAFTKPGNKENIMQLSCVDGSSGKEFDNISDGKVFLIDCAAGKDGNIIESIVKEANDKLYIVKYRNLSEERREEKAQRKAEMWAKVNALGIIELLDQHDALKRSIDDMDMYSMQIMKKDIYMRSICGALHKRKSTSSEHCESVKCAYQNYCGYRWDSNAKTWCGDPQHEEDSDRKRDGGKLIGNLDKMYVERKQLETVVSKVKVKMEMYKSIVGDQHARWNEFSK